MKKSLLAIGLIVSVVIVLSSCKDDLTNETIENGTATIEGTAYANIDLSNDTVGVLYEYVPEGTYIYAIINSSDLVSNPSEGVNYEDIVYTTQVGSGGSFTITVAANSKIVNVTFAADDFIASQVQADESDEIKIFYLPDIFGDSVRQGMSKAIELYFAVEGE